MPITRIALALLLGSAPPIPAGFVLETLLKFPRPAYSHFLGYQIDSAPGGVDVHFSYSPRSCSGPCFDVVELIRFDRDLQIQERRTVSLTGRRRGISDTREGSSGRGKPWMSIISGPGNLLTKSIADIFPPMPP